MLLIPLAILKGKCEAISLVLPISYYSYNKLTNKYYLKDIEKYRSFPRNKLTKILSSLIDFEVENIPNELDHLVRTTPPVRRFFKEEN